MYRRTVRFMGRHMTHNVSPDGTVYENAIQEEYKFLTTCYHRGSRNIRVFLRVFFYKRASRSSLSHTTVQMTSVIKNMPRSIRKPYWACEAGRVPNDGYVSSSSSTIKMETESSSMVRATQCGWYVAYPVWNRSALARRIVRNSQGMIWNPMTG